MPATWGLELRHLVRRFLLASTDPPSDRRGTGPCYSPGEGRKQGDSFAGEGFQALQCVVNTCMVAGAILFIPDVLRLGHSLPMEHEAYSHDQDSNRPLWSGWWRWSRDAWTRLWPPVGWSNPPSWPSTRSA